MGQIIAASLNRRLKEPGPHIDGDGLILLVKGSGSASWILRKQKDGRRVDYGLGGLGDLPIAAAREKAAKYREMIAAGIDPRQVKAKERTTPTFEQAAEKVFQARKRAWKNGKHQQQWFNTLKTYAFPKIGATKVSEISRADIFSVVEPIWIEKNETASRVLQRVLTVLDWAISNGFREVEIPKRAILRGLPKRLTPIRHRPPMPYKDIPAFMARLREKTSFARLALEAKILNVVRSDSVRGARWDEIDLEAKTWTVPVDRLKVKTGKPHIVPLSPAAIDVFERAAALRIGETELVFPGAKPKRPLSDMTLTKILRDMDLPWVPHGFRSSFRDWVYEQTDHSKELAKACMAQKNPDKVDAHYRHGDALEKRQKIMNDWAYYCCPGLILEPTEGS